MTVEHQPTEAHAGDVEKVVEQPVQMSRLPAEDLDETGAARGVRLLQNREASGDRRQGISQLVGEHGEELIAMMLLGLEVVEQPGGVERQGGAQADVPQGRQVGGIVAAPRGPEAERQCAVRLPMGRDGHDHNGAQRHLLPEILLFRGACPVLAPRRRDFGHQRGLSRPDHASYRVFTRGVWGATLPQAFGGGRLDARHRRLLQRLSGQKIGEEDVGNGRHDPAGHAAEGSRIVQRRPQDAADLGQELQTQSGGLGVRPRRLFALQHAIGEVLGRRELFGPLACRDIPQEPPEVAPLALVARERRDREPGGERNAIPRSNPHRPFTLGPGTRVVHAPAEDAEIALVDEPRERLADEEAKRHAEHLSRRPVGVGDDAGVVGDDVAVRAVLQDLARFGQVELVARGFGSSVVALGSQGRRFGRDALEPLLERALLGRYFL